jgi:hypothetical protein
MACNRLVMVETLHRVGIRHAIASRMRKAPKLLRNPLNLSSVIHAAQGQLLRCYTSHVQHNGAPCAELIPARRREAEPAPDARLDPQPQAAQDHQRHRNPAGEPDCLRDVRDRAVQVAEDGNAQHHMERSDEGAFL